jgi:hypothetical protein
MERRYSRASYSSLERNSLVRKKEIKFRISSRALFARGRPTEEIPAEAS